MFINLMELKNYLWITDNTKDGRLNQILVQSRGVIQSSLGDFSEADRTFTFEYCDAQNLELSFNTINITSIISIDWVAFTSDYKILWALKNRIYIKDLLDYLDWERYFDVVVKSWYSYDDTPQALKVLQLQICSLFYAEKSWRLVKTYSLWPRSFTFADSSDTENTVMSINTLLNQYKPLVTI